VYTVGAEHPVSLSDYEVEREVGKGGMGRVYLVRHRATGARRALKVLGGVPDLETLARFRREAEVLARLGGAGVVPVHELGVERGRLGLVMDWMSGGSLADRLVARGQLPWEEAASIVAKVARTLERCSALGLVHRDVKPANVLLDDQGEPRLADFGCVRDLGASVLTQTGTAIGTPFYMAPEQWEGASVDSRADVFSLGVVLYELVTGALPHAGKTPFAVQSAALRGERRRASDSATLPPALEAAIEKALAPAPGRRHAGPGEFAGALEAVLSGKTGSEDTSSRVKRAGLLAAPLPLFVALGLVLAMRDGPRAAPAPAPPAPPPRAPDAPERARASAARSFALQQITYARRCSERQNDDGAADALSKVRDLCAITSAEATGVARSLVAEIEAIAGRFKITERGTQSRAAGQAFRLLELALRFDAGAVGELSVMAQALVAEGFVQPSTADWTARAALADHVLRLTSVNAARPLAHWLASDAHPPDLARARAFEQRIHELNPDAPIVLLVHAEAAWLWPGEPKDAAVARDCYARALRTADSVIDNHALSSTEIFWAKHRLGLILETEDKFEEALRTIPERWDDPSVVEGALNQRVRLLLRTGDLEGARKAANQGQKLGDPAEKAFYDALAHRIAARSEPASVLVGDLIAHLTSPTR
jgi:serine/threonine-protein kinase